MNKEAGVFRKNAVTQAEKSWKQLVQHKWLFLASVVLCLTAAFLINRFTTPVYIVQTSLLVKGTPDPADNPSNLLLSKDSKEASTLPTSTIAQEVAVLYSYPFILKTLQGLDARVSYFSENPEGNKEIYKQAPFVVSFTDTSGLRHLVKKNFGIQFEGDSIYQLKYELDEKENEAKGKLGDTLQVGGCALVVQPRQGGDTAALAGKKFAFQVNDYTEMVYDIKSRLSIESEEESPILAIQLETTNTQFGIDFLNEYTTQYLKDKYEEKSRSASQALAFINEQISTVRGSLGSSENTLANFKASNTFTDAADMASRNLNAISQLEEEKSALLLTDRYYNTLLDDLNRNSGYDQLVTPSSVGISDGLTEGLIRQLAELQIEKNSFAASGGSKNPLIQELDVRINNVKNTLKENLRGLANNNRARLNQVSTRADQFRSQVFAIPKAERRFTDIKRSTDFNDQLYQFLMQKKVDAGILKASATIENKVIEPPYRLGAPLAPKKGRNYVFGFVLGLLLPLGYLRGKNALNQKVTGKEDIQGHTSIPFIGTIYRNLDGNPFAINERSRTAVSESLRILRSNIAYFTKGQTNKVLLVSSIKSGEGKSFASTNIAYSFALAKKKTLLINLDLRVPSKVYEQLGDPANPGITGYLNDHIPAHHIIQETTTPYLHYISTGELPVNPAELLMEEGLQPLIAQLKEQYDFVIIDTPPIGIVADAFILSAYADLTLLVVRDRYTLKESITELEDLYQDGKIKDVGIVLNDYRLEKGSYKSAYYYKN